jgi:uncharacterized Zn finger protein
MLPASAAIQSKAAHLLTTGRVTVVQADDTTGIFAASVLGDHDTYTVWRGGPGDRWWCMCPASLFRGEACSHAAAVALVAG